MTALQTDFLRILAARHGVNSPDYNNGCNALASYTGTGPLHYSGGFINPDSRILARMDLAAEIALACSEAEEAGESVVLMRGGHHVYSWERFDRLVKWAERQGQIMAHP